MSQGNNPEMPPDQYLALLHEFVGQTLAERDGLLYKFQLVQSLLSNWAQVEMIKEIQMSSEAGAMELDKARVDFLEAYGFPLMASHPRIGLSAPINRFGTDASGIYLMAVALPDQQPWPLLDSDQLHISQIERPYRQPQQVGFVTMSAWANPHSIFSSVIPEPARLRLPS